MLTENSSGSYNVEETTGVTTSETTTNTLQEEIGASVSAGWGSFSAEVNATITATESIESTIEMTDSKIKTWETTFPAQSTTQIWQLYFHLQTPTGLQINNGTPYILVLTYPAESVENVVRSQV